MKNFYNVGDKFQLDNQTFTIKTLTDTSIEICAYSGQSIWEKRERFEVNLGITGKTGLFRWQNQLLVKI